jgi:hypothetical protein
MNPQAGFGQFDGRWEAHAALAADTIALKPVRGIPSWLLNVMEWSRLEELAGREPGSYPKDPVGVYRAMQLRIGACMIDQWIPDNPLSMGARGYEDATSRGASTGAECIECDGLRIDSPEAVVEHMERVAFPACEQWSRDLDRDPDGHVARLIEGEVNVQKLLGLSILKAPYGGFFTFPGFAYGRYGYSNYFMAYALYPEVMERGFQLHADAAVKFNRLAARAILEGGLPRLVRLDHDMTDSRGPLVAPETLDRLWYPHFARAIRPLLDAGIRLIWHCDGNVMPMVPRLLECGIAGFQGFQYEDGVDYARICRLTDRNGGPLFIIAGASVTRTLPHGTPDDVRRELRWLVENGPRVGLFLGGSSSIAPGVPRANLEALVEGLAWYREHGRGG